MSGRLREVVSCALQVALCGTVILFALYEFQQHTRPQPMFFSKAETELNGGREDAARKEFDLALSMRPTDPEAFMGVIQACMKQNKLPLAVEYTQRALVACKGQTASVQSAFYEMLADEYTQMEPPAHQHQALDAAKQSYNLSPDNPVAENTYGYLLADAATSRGPDVDTALSILRKALSGLKKGSSTTDGAQLGPLFNAMTEDSYGWALYKNEQYPDAITMLMQAIEDYPEEGSADARKVSYFHLGMSFAKVGKKTQAANAFNSALAYDAKYHDALAGLAALK